MKKQAKVTRAVIAGILMTILLATAYVSPAKAEQGTYGGDQTSKQKEQADTIKKEIQKLEDVAAYLKAKAGDNNKDAIAEINAALSDLDDAKKAVSSGDLDTAKDKLTDARQHLAKAKEFIEQGKAPSTEQAANANATQTATSAEGMKMRMEKMIEMMSTMADKLEQKAKAENNTAAQSEINAALSDLDDAKKAVSSGDLDSAKDKLTDARQHLAKAVQIMGQAEGFNTAQGTEKGSEGMKMRMEKMMKMRMEKMIEMMSTMADKLEQKAKAENNTAAQSEINAALSDLDDAKKAVSSGDLDVAMHKLIDTRKDLIMGLQIVRMEKMIETLNRVTDNLEQKAKAENNTAAQSEIAMARTQIASVQKFLASGDPHELKDALKDMREARKDLMKARELLEEAMPATPPSGTG